MDRPGNVDVMRSLLDNFNEHHKDAQDIMHVTSRVIKAYIETLKGYEEVREKWKMSIDECSELSAKVSNLQKELQQQMKQYQDAQFAVSQVRKILDSEKKKRKLAENDRDFFEAQVNQLSDILKDNINKLSRETKEQLSHIKRNRPSLDILEERVDNVTEFETTGSMISDLSYTRDEDDLNLTSPETRSAKRRAGGQGRTGRKKRRSASAMRFNDILNKSEKVVATTTVTVDGSNVHATAVIESKPDSHNKENFATQPSAPPAEWDDDVRSQLGCGSSMGDVRSPMASNLLNSRIHNFQQKASLKSETCNVCNKRIRFSALCFKCRDCKTACHPLCKDKAPLPCVANGSTPKGCPGLISDYTPIIPPMVPAIVVHCVKEVEARGLSEIGIYRVSGSEREVRLLVEKFKRGKGLPNLSQVMDIHVVCSTLKDFLRSLKDSLTTRQRWNDFAKAIEEENEGERKQRLYRIISSLPQPNRDTLSYLILHLQRVAEAPECKMPLKNLAKVFGPTIIGYSSNNIDKMFNETQVGNKIMEELLFLPANFWECFIKERDPDANLLRTPISRSEFLNHAARSRILKKIKYFETP